MCHIIGDRQGIEALSDSRQTLTSALSVLIESSQPRLL